MRMKDNNNKNITQTIQVSHGEHVKHACSAKCDSIKFQVRIILKGGEMRTGLWPKGLGKM